MEEPKKKRVRLRDTHRWTEEQTRVLLQRIVEAIADNPKKFEQPTAQKFYKIQCKDKILDGIEWKMMRSKIRYLKRSYIKAIQWREQVGSELFQSDKAHVESRMKTICPYYAQLNAIFEPMLPADPIRLTDHDFNKYLPSTTPEAENDLSTDNTDCEESELDLHQNESVVVIPKVENETDDQTQAFEDNLLRSQTTKRKSALYTLNQTNHDNYFDERTDQQEHIENSPYYKSQFELECAKFNLERKKLLFDSQYRRDQKTMSKLQFNLEKEKLEFEKRKFMEDQRLRKYEIDKQFESKKLEIEKDERIRRLELEYKYRNNSNDEEMDFNEKSNNYI